MAPAHAASATLSAVLAAAVALALALRAPVGPWQPLAVIVGWAGAICVVLALLTGWTKSFGTGLVLLVVDAGVGALAGMEAVEVAMTAGLLVLLVEFGAVSFEARSWPVAIVVELARSAAVATASGVVVLTVAVSLAGVTVSGSAAAVLALVVGVVVVSTLLHLARDPSVL